jgi:hypothetical protein
MFVSLFIVQTLMRDGAFGMIRHNYHQDNVKPHILYYSFSKK